MSEIKSANGLVLNTHHWPVETPVSVMMLVHGLGEHGGRYAPMARFLNEHNIAVVGVDLHGHGKTDGKRGVIASYDDFRADLSSLIDFTKHLYPDTDLTLYGHSMGGGIVLDFGINVPSGLPIIASAPLIALPNPVPAPLRFIIKALARIKPDLSLSQPLVGEKISTLADEQELYDADPLNHNTLGFKTAVEIVENGERLSELAHRWDRPLLLLHSKDDQLTAFDGSETFASEASQVEFHAFENCAHEMHNDVTREAVHHLMRDFILKHAKAKPS